MEEEIINLLEYDEVEIDFLKISGQLLETLGVASEFPMNDFISLTGIHMENNILSHVILFIPDNPQGIYPVVEPISDIDPEKFKSNNYFILHNYPALGLFKPERQLKIQECEELTYNFLDDVEKFIESLEDWDKKFILTDDKIINDHFSEKYGNFSLITDIEDYEVDYSLKKIYVMDECRYDDIFVITDKLHQKFNLRDKILSKMHLASDNVIPKGLLYDKNRSRHENDKARKYFKEYLKGLELERFVDYILLEKRIVCIKIVNKYIEDYKVQMGLNDYHNLNNMISFLSARECCDMTPLAPISSLNCLINFLKNPSGIIIHDCQYNLKGIIENLFPVDLETLYQFCLGKRIPTSPKAYEVKISVQYLDHEDSMTEEVIINDLEKFYYEVTENELFQVRESLGNDRPVKFTLKPIYFTPWFPGELLEYPRDDSLRLFDIKYEFDTSLLPEVMTKLENGSIMNDPQVLLDIVSCMKNFNSISGEARVFCDTLFVLQKYCGLKVLEYRYVDFNFMVIPRSPYDEVDKYMMKEIYLPYFTVYRINQMIDTESLLTKLNDCVRNVMLE